MNCPSVLFHHAHIMHLGGAKYQCSSGKGDGKYDVLWYGIITCCGVIGEIKQDPPPSILATLTDAGTDTDGPLPLSRYTLPLTLSRYTLPLTLSRYTLPLPLSRYTLPLSL